jgi:phenylacetate-CoA ligase
VLSHGQQLDEAERAEVEAAFGCKALDLYRSGEFGDIACEAEPGSGHLVAAEGYVVEVLVNGRPAAPGESGELFVTDLNNLCMPFIRYATGDRAVLLGPDASFPNSRGLPRLGKLLGRRPAIIQGAEDARVPSGFFSALLSEYGYAVSRFSVSAQAGGLQLTVQKAPRYSDQTLEEIKGRIVERLGQIDIQVVFEPPPPEALKPPPVHSVPQIVRGV